MGCDIHVYLEQEKTVNGKKKWVNIDHWTPNPYAEDEGENPMSIVEFYKGRNYWLFATLANVRNGNKFPYMADPKGLPADVSKEVQKENDQWGCDGHSHSYFNLAELLEWEKKTLFVEITGTISKKQYDELQKGVTPTSWCEWTSDKTAVKTTWKDINNSLQPFVEAMKKRIFDGLWMGEAHFEEYIKENAKKYRAVFWFDN